MDSLSAGASRIPDPQETKKVRPLKGPLGLYRGFMRLQKGYIMVI